MKKFTKKEIDDWRKKFSERGYPKEVAELDGRSKVNYFIMPRDLFQGIPNGLFRMTGGSKAGYLIGVSDEVPRLVQPYFAVSEHDEFMVYGLDDEDRTLHSEQKIVGFMGEENPTLRNQYISSKIVLYDHILEHSRENLESWGFTQEDWDGFRRAYDYLQYAANNNENARRNLHKGLAKKG